MSEVSLSPQALKQIEEKKLERELQYPDFDGPLDMIEYHGESIEEEIETQIEPTPKKKKVRRKKRLTEAEIAIAQDQGVAIRGRQQKHSDQVIADTLYDFGGNMRKVAVELDYNYRRLRFIINNNEELRSILEDARDNHKEETLDRVEDRLEMMARSGDIKAMTIYLKAHGKTRGYVDKRELSTANDAPLQVVVRRSS